MPAITYFTTHIWKTRRNLIAALTLMLVGSLALSGTSVTALYAAIYTDTPAHNQTYSKPGSQHDPAILAQAPQSGPPLAQALMPPSQVAPATGSCTTSSFGAATNVPVGNYPYSVAVGDFNGDGIKDLAAANYSSNNVSILLNDCRPPVTLVGHVTWQGRAPQPNVLQVMPLTITLKLGATEANYPPYLVTDASGFFTASLTGLPAGIYNWRVKGPAYLATTGSVTLNSGATSLEMGVQPAGNINGDNVCSAQDFTILKGNFGAGGAPPIKPSTGK